MKTLDQVLFTPLANKYLKYKRKPDFWNLAFEMSVDVARKNIRLSNDDGARLVEFTKMAFSRIQQSESEIVSFLTRYGGDWK